MSTSFHLRRLSRRFSNRRSSNGATSSDPNVRPSLALVVPPSSARSSLDFPVPIHNAGTTTTATKTGRSFLCCARDAQGDFAVMNYTGPTQTVITNVITNPARVSRLPSQFTPTQSISHFCANSARNNLSPGHGLSPSFRASAAGSNMSGPYSAVSELENTQRPVETRGNPVSECPGNHSPHPNRPRSLTAPSPSVEYIQPASKAPGPGRRRSSGFVRDRQPNNTGAPNSQGLRRHSTDGPPPPYRVNTDGSLPRPANGMRYEDSDNQPVSTPAGHSSLRDRGRNWSGFSFASHVTDTEFSARPVRSHSAQR